MQMSALGGSNGDQELHQTKNSVCRYLTTKSYCSFAIRKETYDFMRGEPWVVLINGSTISKHK